MSIFSRFFGSKDTTKTAEVAPLVANADLKNRVSLQVVFSDGLNISAEALGAALRAYDSSMGNAQVELEPGVDFFGLAGWGEHVVQMVGFNAPYPVESLERCVAPAHYGQEVKAQVRANASHIILYYAGHDTRSLEQYVALAAVVGALSKLGALAVLNEHAHTSLPAGVIGEHTLEMLREGLPLSMLFCGFVKYEVEGVSGVWMRTYGADAFDLPNFAVLAAGHHEGGKYSDLINNVWIYLLQSGARMVAGDTMQVGEAMFMKLREPTESEYFLDDPAEVLVLELIEEEQVNSLH